MNINREIVNRALNKAGEEPITDKEWEAGTGTRIRLVKDYYLATILETLSNTAWTSRKKRAKLMPYTEGNLTDYCYVYLLPPDCAKPVSVNDNAEFILEGAYLYCDEAEAVLMYVSNGYTGEYKYKKLEVQPTAETFKANTFYYKDENENFILAETFAEGKEYYEIDHEDYDKYEDMVFDPLLSEYIETRLAAKMVLKLTGKTDLYQLLYSESQLMENRAVKASVAHGYNKDEGNRYWGEVLGLPDYGDNGGRRVNY